ncbi:hypothetical protein ACU8KH_04223 [Lachancea thermotolerans]
MPLALEEPLTVAAAETPPPPPPFESPPPRSSHLPYVSAPPLAFAAVSIGPRNPA